MNSTARRLAVVCTAAGIAVVLAAGPALAHVEVEAAPARALATDALLSLTAEAESGTAGISGLRIQLPAGLVPADLRLASGPAGWRLTGTGDVVTVTGPALPVGRSLRLGIRVRQLPDDRQLVLKTVQSYTDGKQDAWIELPTASVPEPEQPAPIVRLQAAAPGATAVPRATPTTPAPTTSAPAPTPRSSGAVPAADPADDGSVAVWMFGGVLAGIAVLGAIVLAARRRLR
ncbi:MAG TPA: DUF1775 domain-containing protein [Mycobacteriales bacterium]